MQDFINKANQYGKVKRPFFFVIDFEQEKPLLFPLEEAQASGLFLTFFVNLIYKSVLKKPLNFSNSQQIQLLLANTKKDLSESKRRFRLAIAIC